MLSAKARDKSRHEIVIETALCGMLGKQNSTTFGEWNYISWRGDASPFKPVDYVDMFGYRYILGYKTISKYL